MKVAVSIFENAVVEKQVVVDVGDLPKEELREFLYSNNFAVCESMASATTPADIDYQGVESYEFEILPADSVEEADFDYSKQPA